MPDKTFSIEVRGIDKVLNNIKNLTGDIQHELAAALYQEAQELITEAKQEVPVDLGTLRASGYVEPPITEGTKITVQCGFGGPAAPYALYVHEGTGPAVGHGQYMPPKGALEQWARSHGFEDEGAVRWAIYQHGTKPHKYLEEPFNRRAAGVDMRIGARLKEKLGG